MRKILVVFVLLVVLSICFAGYTRYLFADGKLHLVVCDVGQGDGILIRTPSGRDIVIDGGPDDQMLACLGEHMPFWDRQIELMVLTHPHADHSNGLVSIAQRYRVAHFMSAGVFLPEDPAMRALAAELQKARTSIRDVTTGDTVRFPDGVVLRVVWPEQGMATSYTQGGDLNETSVVLLLTHGSFTALLTGDAGITSYLQLAESLPDVDVLKVPHHGSATGMDAEVVKRVNPELGIVSLGKNNYGHPSPVIVELFADNKIPLLRTDKQGSVVIESDGRTWKNL